jgi:hypothetical protein
MIEKIKKHYIEFYGENFWHFTKGWFCALIFTLIVNVVISIF